MGADAVGSRLAEDLGLPLHSRTDQVLAPDGAMAIVIAPWTSVGYYEDGWAFPRPGRATMVFSKNGDQWLCTHSHMSLNRGVPQASYANRPVKAW